MRRRQGIHQALSSVSVERLHSSVRRELQMTGTRGVPTSSRDARHPSDTYFVRRKGSGAGKGPHSKERVLPALGTLTNPRTVCLKVDLERPGLYAH